MRSFVDLFFSFFVTENVSLIKTPYLCYHNIIKDTFFSQNVTSREKNICQAMIYNCRRLSYSDSPSRLPPKIEEITKTMVDFGITDTLCTSEVRKPRLPGVKVFTYFYNLPYITSLCFFINGWKILTRKFSCHKNLTTHI